MKVIEPKPLTLISSNIPEETAYPVWGSATTYDTGDIVLVTDLSPNGITKLFKSLTDGNTGNYPPEHPDKWGDLGATNRWKFLDEHVHSQTIYPNVIDVIVSVRKVDHVVLLEVEAQDLLFEMIDPSDNSVVFSQSCHLQIDNSLSWSDYFFGDFEYRRSVLLNIPLYLGEMYCRINLTGSVDIKLGGVVLGKGKYMGQSLWGARVGIRDFSKKETDEDLGITFLNEGSWAKRMEIDLLIQSNAVDKIQRRLAELRAKPCVWIANNDFSNPDLNTNYEALIVYGFYKDFEVVLPGPVVSNCTLTIEGLI